MFWKTFSFPPPILTFNQLRQISQLPQLIIFNTITTSSRKDLIPSNATKSWSTPCSWRPRSPSRPTSSPSSTSRGRSSSWDKSGEIYRPVRAAYNRLAFFSWSLLLDRNISLQFSRFKVYYPTLTEDNYQLGDNSPDNNYQRHLPKPL